MESKTMIKNVRISPKKLRFLLKEVKKLTPKQALDYLYYTPKKGAKILYQAIKSAINNAKNYLKVDEDLLKFKVLAVDEGIKLKRYRPGGRGIVRPYMRRFSHVSVVLVKDEDKIEDPKKIKEITTSEKKATDFNKEVKKKTVKKLK